MFTGIISELGVIKKVSASRGGKVFEITAPKSARELKIGSSIAVNGACHTIVKKSARTFCVESVPETLSRTNLGELKINDGVNLELPLRVSERFDGHIVTGHIDGVATIRKIKPDKNSILFTLKIPSALKKFIVEKGSVAFDGISLTIAAIKNNQITVAIIPHTLKVTNLGRKKIGAHVNVEVDILAKHLAKLSRK